MAMGAGVGLAACGGNEKGGDTGGAESAEVAEVRAAIDGYASWPQPEPGIIASSAGHGDYVQNWVNPTADAHIAAAAGGDMPDGSILVKQGYADAAGTELANLTVMHKTGGDWFWVAFKPDGSVAVEGYTADVQGACVGCHEADPGQQDLVVTYDW
jgi:hypothetical protein